MGYDSAVMDMAFPRRAERMLGDRKPLRLDHALLMASLAAQQTAVAAARAATGPARPGGDAAAEEDLLTELLLAGPRWRQAAHEQRGCFSRAEAGRRINDP